MPFSRRFSKASFVFFAYDLIKGKRLFTVWLGRKVFALYKGCFRFSGCSFFYKAPDDLGMVFFGSGSARPNLYCINWTPSLCSTFIVFVSSNKSWPKRQRTAFIFANWKQISRFLSIWEINNRTTLKKIIFNDLVHFLYPTPRQWSGYYNLKLPVTYLSPRNMGSPDIYLRPIL